MPGSSDLITIASIVAAFGVAMLFFRIRRELEMGIAGERVWIPWADWLIVIATLCSLLLVLLPIIVFGNKVFIQALSNAACAGCVILIAGYVLAILAHYRLLFGSDRTGPRDNPEPAEKLIFFLSIIVASGLGFSLFIINLI